jgi:hypothetical protein
MCRGNITFVNGLFQFSGTGWSGSCSILWFVIMYNCTVASTEFPVGMRTMAACPKIIYEYIVNVRIMCYVKIRSEKPVGV